MRKEVFESGHIQPDQVARSGAVPSAPAPAPQEGTDGEGNNLSAFMHTTAREVFLPMLVTDCKNLNLKVICRLFLIDFTFSFEIALGTSYLIRP